VVKYSAFEKPARRAHIARLQDISKTISICHPNIEDKTKASKLPKAEV
jgi:hypothetical protein